MSRILAASIDYAHALNDARRDLLDAAPKFASAEERTRARDELMASVQSFLSPKRGERVALRVDENGTAYIPIMGGLVPNASPCGALAGEAETEYGFIQAAIAEAEASPDVTNAVFETDSLGGDVNGLDETAQAIANMTKPTTAVVHNAAASAAYYLISQADRIIALSPMAQIGSVGVVGKLQQDDGKGAVFVSSGAPKKIPDISTKEGRSVIQARIDDLHSIFVRRVADGRGVTEEKVASDFGQGDMLIAEKALAAGMIDEVRGVSISRRNKPGVAGEQASAENAAEVSGGHKVTTLDEFRAANPGVLEAHDAAIRTAALADGAKAEAARRDGLSAFLGKTKEGDKAVAEAIASGKSVQDAMPALVAATIPSSMNLADDNAPVVHGQAPGNGAGTDGLDEEDHKAMDVFGLKPDELKKFGTKEAE